MIERVKKEVENLLGQDNKAHGFKHVERVTKIALDLAQKEGANKEVIAIASLLHDCDDYKMFGHECAENLTNSKKIMNIVGVDINVQKQVLHILKNMGYSNAIKGIRPTSLEGQIVSDADMLEAIGIVGVTRTLTYTVLKKGEGKVFDADVFPKENLTPEEYKLADRKEDNFINHHFDKILKIKNLIFTKSGREKAKQRHASVVFFLREFFREQGLNNWIEYLEKFEKNNS